MEPNKYDKAQDTFLGYPCNLAYDYSELFPMLKYHFNNVGSPYEESRYRLNTKEHERNVLDFFADLWNFDKNNVWGYITSNGTEGNMQAFYIARMLFPDAMVYTSTNTHNSINKICKLLNIPLCMINCQENGEMDYKHFEQMLQVHKHKPAIINANLGTAMLGATDNTREIYRIICKHNKQDDYYMHADGTLMGFVLPFLELDLFFKKPIHSISISGHKFLGVPFPCGIFMIEKRFLDVIGSHIDIIGAADCTISGSRNGHSALFLNHIIRKKEYLGFEDDIMECIDNSEYLITQLNKLGYNGWRNQNSLTVVMDKPYFDITQKWQMPVVGNNSHVVVLPHVTKKKINTFVKDLRLKHGCQINMAHNVSLIRK